MAWEHPPTIFVQFSDFVQQTPAGNSSNPSLSCPSFMARGLKKAKTANPQPSQKRKRVDLAKELSSAKSKIKRQKRRRLWAAFREEEDPQSTSTSNATNNTNPVPVRPKPGDVCPWWKEELLPTYDKVPTVQSNPNIQSIPLMGNSKSWFSVQSIPLRNASDFDFRSRMEFDPADIWSQEAGADRKAATARKGKALDPIPKKQVRCRKIRIRFLHDDEGSHRKHEATLRKWMGAYRFTYNHAVNLVKQNKGWLGAEGQYLNEQLVYETKNGRTSRPTGTEEEKKFAKLCAANMEVKRNRLGVEVGALVRAHPWLLDVPSKIRKEAVRDVLKAEKSNQGMRKSDPKHKWSLKLKSRKQLSSWTISVPSECICKVKVEDRPGRRVAGENVRKWTRLTLSPTYDLGEFWLNEAVPEGKISKDCKITVDGLGRYYMVIPYEIEPVSATKKPLSERAVGAVDPGDRIRACVADVKRGEVIKYAEGKRFGGKDRIYALCKLLDDTIAESNAKATDAKQRLWYKKKMVKLRAKVHNLTTEMIHKIALDLERRFDTLILPPFKTSEMVKRRQKRNGMAGVVELQPRKIHSKVARSLLSGRHYEGSVHTMNVFLRAGKEVVRMGEEYTTMTCKECGILNDKHSNESWTCKNDCCETFHLRDPAASLCIFKKALARN